MLRIECAIGLPGEFWKTDPKPIRVRLLVSADAGEKSMDEHFDSQLVLRAAEIVRKNAAQEGDVPSWRGVSLLISPDEYTISLKWRTCTLHVFFHNRFEFNGGSRTDFENMMQALAAIVKEDDDAMR